MSYFNQDFIKFFKELESNNNREWFNENKERYIHSVKDPFFSFVEEMIHRISEDNDSFNIAPKEAIFRIYRDVRFSKNKLPYKTTASAIISPGGRKDFTTPGYYLELSAEGVKFYGGAHFLNKEQLQKLREYIVENMKEFKALQEDNKFKNRFGKLLGEQNKRVPKEFKEAMIKEPLIANKQFYYYAKLGVDKMLSKALVNTLMNYYSVGKPINLFLEKGIAG